MKRLPCRPPVMVTLGGTWQREFTAAAALPSCPSTEHTEHIAQNGSFVLAESCIKARSYFLNMSWIVLADGAASHSAWACLGAMCRIQTQTWPQSSTLSSRPSTQALCCLCRIAQRRHLKWSVGTFTIVGTERLWMKMATFGSWGGAMMSSMLPGRCGWPWAGVWQSQMPHGTLPAWYSSMPWWWDPQSDSEQSHTWDVLIHGYQDTSIIHPCSQKNKNVVQGGGTLHSYEEEPRL